MTATVLKINNRFSAKRLECSACGASAAAACDCGAPYVPNAMQKRETVAKLLKADPKKSNLSVAKKAGVNDKTVAAVRCELESNSEIPNKTEREEDDGRKARGRKPSIKSREPKAKAALLASDPIEEECADCETPAQHWQRSLGNLAGDAIAVRDYWSREFGKWEKFEVPSSLVTLAKQAAKVWTNLAADLAKQRRR